MRRKPSKASDQYQEKQPRRLGDSLDVDHQEMDASSDLFTAFASSLQSTSDALDNEAGLAVSWAAALESDDSELELERNTWELIHALYSSRAQPLAVLDAQSAFLPPTAQARLAVNSNRDLLDLLTIRDWLHSIAPDIHPAEIRRNYLPYTKNALKSHLRAGKRHPRHLPASLDPDATFRASGTQLESEDAAYETALVRTLFEYVRIGELATAVDMCRQSDQSWRAASLSGGNLFRDSVLDADDSEMDQDGRASQGGNLNRQLWKMTCQKLASSPVVSKYERALYGALSGDLQSVLPACETWEDQLWAHVNHLLETRIDAHIAAAPAFFSKRAIAPDAAAPASKDLKADLAAAFDSMLQAPKEQIQQEARHPLRMAQSYVIQDQSDELIETFVDRLEGAGDDVDEVSRANLLRFFAHFVLFLRKLDIAVPSEASTKILDAYVQILQLHRKDELVALYASTLDTTVAVETYAQFLASISAQSDRTTRREALFKCRDTGIDFVQVAVRVVELILAETLEDSPELDEAHMFNSSVSLGEPQTQLIRSLEWLTFDRATYVQAHLQANALVRWFLVAGHTFAASQLLRTLPPDLDQAIVGVIDTNQDPFDPLRNSSREFEDFKLFFTCLGIHEQFNQLWATRPPRSVPRFDQQPFIETVKRISEQFHQVALQLLESEWLKSDVAVEQGEEADARLAELHAIRQIYIPELVFRLHTALYDTRELLPSNLQKAIDLANIVADEYSSLYQEFLSPAGNRMPDYLGRVREACMASLEHSTNPFVVAAAVQ